MPLSLCLGHPRPLNVFRGSVARFGFGNRKEPGQHSPQAVFYPLKDSLQAVYLSPPSGYFMAVLSPTEPQGPERQLPLPFAPCLLSRDHQERRQPSPAYRDVAFRRFASDPPFSRKCAIGRSESRHQGTSLPPISTPEHRLRNTLQRPPLKCAFRGVTCPE